MMLAQSLTAIIIFWAIIGGLGASLLLPAMQSLIHGNFEGEAQKKTYAMVGAAMAIAAAIGPLIGGLVTTALSWRVGFLLEVVVIALVLANIKLIREVPYTGPRHIDVVGALLSVVGMGGVVLGVLVWQEGGEAVGALLALGVLGLGSLAYWLVHRKRQGRLTLLDPDLFRFPHFRIGVSQQMLQQIALGGAMIALPIFLQLKLEYNALQAGLSLAPLSLSMFAVAILAGRKAGGIRQPPGDGWLRPDGGPDGAAPAACSACGLRLEPGPPAAHRRLWSRAARLPAEQLHARSHRGGPGQRGGRRQLRRGVLRAVLRPGGGRRLMLAVLAASFTGMSEASTVLPPEEKAQIAQVLEDDAQVMSDTQLTALLEGQPEAIQDEVLRINDAARDRSLQVALLVPLLAAALGLLNGFRMMRLPDLKPVAREGIDLA